MLTSQLLAQIRKVAEELPPPLLEAIVGVLRIQGKYPFSEDCKGKLLQTLPHTHWRQVVSDLLEIWWQEPAYLGGEAIATALSMAAYCEAETRKELSVEIVWTGPEGSSIPMRRTEQVLLQLIQEAKQELTIVSFAVYKVPEITQALIAALDRGVHLRIIAETPEVGTDQVPFGVVAGLGREVANRSQVLIWDKAKRPKDADGRHGSLHMKCAIADRQHVFISSANLTEYALTLNMEMGFLIHSQDTACQVAEHIDGLVCHAILT